MSVELEVSVTLLCVVEHQQNIEHQLQLIPPSSTLVSAQNQPRDSLTMQWHFTVRGYEDHLLPTLYDIWQCHWQLPMTTTQSPHWRSTQKRAIRTRRWCLLHLVTHSKTSQWRKVKEMLPVWLCTSLSSRLRPKHPPLPPPSASTSYHHLSCNFLDRLYFSSVTITFQREGMASSATSVQSWHYEWHSPNFPPIPLKYQPLQFKRLSLRKYLYRLVLATEIILDLHKEASTGSLSSQINLFWPCPAHFCASYQLGPISFQTCLKHVLF